MTSTYRELMRIGQPYDNHNIGQISFNPTAGPGDADYGNLYVAMGDGGLGGDPHNMAQDIDVTPDPRPFGKVLRIDPIASGSNPYTIPSDNPFAGQANRVQETWAYGLRNPHKYTWDDATGVMYIADIGQGNVEEINIVHGGANYGWDVREGSLFSAAAAFRRCPPATRQTLIPIPSPSTITTSTTMARIRVLPSPAARCIEVPRCRN